MQRDEAVRLFDALSERPTLDAVQLESRIGQIGEAAGRVYGVIVRPHLRRLSTEDITAFHDAIERVGAANALLTIDGDGYAVID